MYGSRIAPSGSLRMPKSAALLRWSKPPSALARGASGPCSWRPSGWIAPTLAWTFALVCVLYLAGAALAQPKFPPLSGRIVDEVGLLSADDKRALEGELKALEEKSTDQLVVYIARSLEGYPIEDFGYRLGRFWQIGQKDKNNGVILIVAPNERKVRIEVGRGLEPQLTDLMSKLIIENAVLPAFRRNDFAGGIKAGVRDIRDVLLGDVEAVKQRAKSGAKRSPATDSGQISLIILGFFIVMAFIVVWVQSRQTARPTALARARRRNGARTVPASAPWWSSGGWGGGSGGWESGGGGFSGGGGDFGGGGSSGSW